MEDLISLPPDLLLCIMDFLTPFEKLSLALSSRSILIKVIESNHLFSALANIPRTDSPRPARPSITSRIVRGQKQNLLEQTARTSWLYILQRDLQSHIFCPDCNILHHWEPLVPPGVSIARRCYLPNFPWPNYLSSLQMDLRGFNEWVYDFHQYEPSMVLDRYLHTDFSSSSTIQICMQSKAVQGRFLVRSYFSLLLPPGANSTHPRHLSPKLLPQFQSQVNKFTYQIETFLRLLRRRQPALPSTPATRQYQQELREAVLPYADVAAGPVAEVIGAIIHPLHTGVEIRTVREKGKGVATYVTMWHDLGWCKDDMQGTAETWVNSEGEPISPRRMYEQYYAHREGPGSMHHRCYADHEQFLKRRPKWKKD